MSDNAVHSATGASSMERWEACPGSVALIPSVERTSTPYADEGTQAHDLAARWLKTGVEPVFPSEEMRVAVRSYVQICLKYIQMSQMGLGATFGVEHRFQLNADVFGTVDFWAYWPWLKRLIVIDFKNGAGLYVSVRDNLQCQYYATALYYALGLPVEQVEVGIVQPRCMVGTELPPFRTVEYPVTHLHTFFTRMREGIEATKSPFAPLVTGPHCAKTFCPVSAICPQMVAEGKQALQTITEPAKGQAYDPKELAYWLGKRAALKRFIRSLDAFAYAELRAGRTIPGFKLEEKRAQRRYMDSTAMANRFALSGAGEEVYEARVLKSPNQIETTCPQWMPLLEGMTEKESSGYNLAEDTDERPAVDNSPGAGFQPIIHAANLADIFSPHSCLPESGR